MSKHTIVHTDAAPKAIGPYCQGTVFENLVFASGQIAMNPADNEMVGTTIEEQSEQCLKNLRAVLEAAGSDFAHVVKATVFLSDMDNFASFNQVYSKYFGSSTPARSCIAVKTLPKNALVEVEAIATKK